MSNVRAIFLWMAVAVGCGDDHPPAMNDATPADDAALPDADPGVCSHQVAAAALAAGTWDPRFTLDGLGVDGQLDQIAASPSCDIWAMGQLEQPSGDIALRVTHFTGTAWAQVALDFEAGACTGFAVSPTTGDVSVGCTVSVPGRLVGRIYRVTGSAVELVADELPHVDVVAYAPDGTLWIGGGSNAGFLGRLDGTSVTTVEAGFDRPVRLLDVASSTDIVVAGPFLKIGNTNARGIARWDGTAWQPLGMGVRGYPNAIARSATTVYATTSDLLLGAFDGTQWTELATAASGLTRRPEFHFRALEVVGDAVVAVGRADLTDGSGSNALVYQGGMFRSLGGGVQGTTVSGLAVTSDAVWIGGDIVEVGPAGSRIPSLGVARYQLAD